MPQNSIKILLVDDSPFDRGMVRRELRNEFDQVDIVEVKNQVEFSKALADTGFDLVITDFQIRWTDGLQVLQSAKENFPDCPVLMFTATGSEEIAVEAMKNGLDDYIIKNVNHMVRLRTAVRSSLELNRTRLRAARLENDLAHMSRVTSVGEMATVLAHEVNQPLAAIANYASTSLDLMENEKISTAELKQVLRRIYQQASQAGKIVNRLKRFVSRAAPRFSSLNINDLVRDVSELMESQLVANHIELELALDESLPPLRLDALQIQQVLVNLIQNAIESMIPTKNGDGQIKVQTVGDDGQVRVCVTDQGDGIDRENTNKLFESYFTTKQDGLGMGLNICQRIVEAHGGVIAARANDGQGATFEFSLPNLPNQVGEAS